MKKFIPFLLVAFLAGCSQPQTGPASASRTAKDPKLAAIEDRVKKTTPEGNQMVEKIKAMKPEVNDQVSGKSLGEIIDEYSKNKGIYNILPIGWEASEKKNKRWKLVFNYQDWQKQYLAAEWEYNPETNKLYPFEFDNAKGFWLAEEKPAPGAKAKK
jgi:hypothetical protein